MVIQVLDWVFIWKNIYTVKDIKGMFGQLEIFKVNYVG